MFEPLIKNTRIKTIVNKKNKTIFRDIILLLNKYFIIPMPKNIPMETMPVLLPVSISMIVYDTIKINLVTLQNSFVSNNNKIMQSDITTDSTGGVA